MGGLIGRREILKAGLAAGAAGLVAPARLVRAADSVRLNGVTWGGAWINSWKDLLAKQNRFEVDWTLHEAATTAVVAKIRAAWPKTPIDFVNASGPTFFAMMREGWLEPLRPDIVPNLAFLPEPLFVRDAAGATVAVPTNLSTVFWVYDQKAAGMRIEKPEDLLSPKLRGKIMLNVPSIASGAQIYSLALTRGGDEHEIEPGFDFIKEIAKSGNVGRVVKTDVEIANAFTTGEVAVGLINMGNYHDIRQHVDLTLLNRVPGSPTFKSFFGFEGIAVLKKEGDRRPALEFVNYCLDAANDSAYAAKIGSLPANARGTAAPDVAALQLNEAERKEFGRYPDTAYISTKIGDWNRKWELEVAPLL